MDAARAAVRALRHRFGEYAEADQPIAVASHGRTVGVLHPGASPARGEGPGRVSAGQRIASGVGAGEGRERGGARGAIRQAGEESSGIVAERSVVLEANIVLGTMLGKRLREMLGCCTAGVGRIVPDEAVAKSRSIRRRLPPRLECRCSSRGPSMNAWLCSCRSCRRPLRRTMQAMRMPASTAWTLAIGEPSPARCCWRVRSGPRSGTSSAVACRFGRRMASSFISRKAQRAGPRNPAPRHGGS